MPLESWIINPPISVCILINLSLLLKIGTPTNQEFFSNLNLFVCYHDRFQQHIRMFPHLHPGPAPNHAHFLTPQTSFLHGPHLVLPGRPNWKVRVQSLHKMNRTRVEFFFVIRLYLWNIQKLRQEPPLSHSHFSVPPDAHACVGDSWQSPAQPCGLTDMLVCATEPPLSSFTVWCFSSVYNIFLMVSTHTLPSFSLFFLF